MRQQRAGLSGALLVLDDPASYDLIRSDDRLSLIDLGRMAAGKPVVCRVAHADGTELTLLLRHSYSERQLTWFRSGSALGAMHAP